MADALGVPIIAANISLKGDLLNRFVRPESQTLASSGVMSTTLRTHAHQLVRFASVSLFCFALGICVLAGLHELAGVHFLVAYVASFVVTSTLGYLLNGRYTFRARGGDKTGLLRYTSVNVCLLIANGAALRFLVEHFHVWYLGATLCLAAVN